MGKEKTSRLIAQNKKAYHDYFIEETYQAGISLAGTEVKSLRLGKCSLKESFIRIENGSEPTADTRIIIDTDSSVG